MNMKINNVLVQHQSIQMRDGINLSADIFIPQDNGKHPTLLIRTPYPRTKEVDEFNAIDLTRNGWIVVIQNVRGRLGSEGIFNPFIQEIADGADTIDWCVKQPWSNSKIVMSGASYVGLTPWLAAIQPSPKELVGISSHISSSNVSNDWFFEGGALRQAFIQSWGLSLVLTDSKASVNHLKIAKIYEKDLVKLYTIPPSESPLVELLPQYSNWIDLLDKKYWKNIEDPINRTPSTLPRFFIAGWFDFFCEGTIHDYMESVQTTNTTVRRNRIIIGPWSHYDVYSQKCGDLDFGVQANGSLEGIFPELFTWFNNIINDAPTLGGAKVFIMGKNVWHEFPEWPPETSELKLYLSSINELGTGQFDNILSKEKQKEIKSRSFLHDPKNPVPTVGGRTLDPVISFRAGPVDQRSIENRADVLTYTSEVLSRDLYVIGLIKAVITFATSGYSADIAIKLIDVYPDGKSINIVDSVQRSRFTPDKKKTITIQVGSTAMMFAKGHRIRIQISSSNFPHFDLNPSTKISSLKAKEYKSSRQTIYSGGIKSSYISIPVYERFDIINS